MRMLPNFAHTRAAVVLFAVTLMLPALSSAQDVTSSPTSLSWGGVQVGQTSGTKSVTITNGQSVPLTISSITVPSGSDFVQGSTTCPLAPSTLAAAGTCTIAVNFRPLAQGTRTNALTLTDDAPSQTQTVPLSGSGTIGPLLYSPTSLSFAGTPVGSVSAAQKVLLTNTTSSAITLTSITHFGKFAESDDCPISPSSLAANASCNVTVTFTPNAAGTWTGAVIAHYSTTETDLFLSGTTSSVALSPASFNFGNVQVSHPSSPQNFTLTNNNSQALTVNSIATTNSDYAASSNCPTSPSTLAPNASCTVTVVYTPSTSGPSTETLTISHSAPGSPATAALSGTGTVPATGVTFAPTALSWPNTQIGQGSGTKSVTLTNNNSAALSISSIAVGSSEFQISSTTCPFSPATLAAGASCTISAFFRPLAQGPRSDMIMVTDDDAQSPQQVPLSGTAVVGPVLYSPTSLTFPSTAAGSTSASQTATLTNKQATALSISFAVSGQFAQTNDCPASLPANASCTLSVSFAPSAAGSKTGSINVNYGSGTQSLYLSGTATGGGTSGAVTVSPKQFTFPTQTTGSTSAPEAITLTNGQSVALSISSIQISSPFHQTNNCGTSVAAGKNCTITVTYSPTAVGFTSTNLVITDNGAGSPRNVAIAGNAAAAVTTIPKVGGLHFFNQIVQTTSSPLSLTVTNNQTNTLTIKSITSTADYPFTTSCVDSSGSGTLASQASCTVSVSFDPQAIGSRPATMSIAEDADASPLSIPLAGMGIAGDPGITVTVEPNAPCTGPSETRQFTAAVTGTSNNAVTWYVDNILNGNSSVGTITAGGLYTPPSTQVSHTIKAVSQASKSVSGTTTVSVTTAPVFAIYPFTSSLPPMAQQTFQAQVCYVPDTHPVTWTVDNIPGGNSAVGTVTSQGLYTAPATVGKHTVRVTDATLNKTSGGVVTVFSNIAVDFGSRTVTTNRIPANLFGAGRAEAMQKTADRALITQAGVTVARLYGQIPLVFATQTPDWTKIDPMIASIQAAGQQVLLQLSYSPPWLQPSPNTCGAGNATVAPKDVNAWGQIAAAYVAHMDAAFPGFVRDYEIWNEPNSSGLCSGNRLNSYLSIYGAAAPLMKQQAATDGATIRIGGPVLSGFSALWLTNLLTNTSTAPYVDFISYHQYLFGTKSLQVKWDTYNGNNSVYQLTQDPSVGPAAVFNKVYAQAKAGKQPLGANTPIYVTEFNTNFAFFKDCCRNDPTFAPVWNALYVTDLLNNVYSAVTTEPSELVYFASSAYPYFCLVGTPDQNMDCNYSEGSTPQPYPQYYAFQLLASPNYLGLVSGGFMAKSIAPSTGAGGIAVTAFYNASQDAVYIVNPTATSYSQIPVSLQNLGFATPNATLYRIVNGASISSTSLPLTTQGANFGAAIDIPAYSVQAISVKGQ